MECEKIKKIIPKYFQHVVSEEEIQLVEEHLCVCHDCRTILGKLMDKLEVNPYQESEKVEKETEEKVEKTEEVIETPQVSPEQEKDMEYFSGEGLEFSSKKGDEILEVTEPAKQEVEEKVEENPEDKKSSFDILAETPLNNQELSSENILVPQKEESPAEFNLEKDKEETPLESVLEKDPEVSKFFVREKAEDVHEEPAVINNQVNREPIVKVQGEDGNFLGYLCLVVGLGVLGFLAYLLLKG